MRLLLWGLIFSIGSCVGSVCADAKATNAQTQARPAQAAVSDPQVGALVEALRQAAPKTGTQNSGAYSEWQIIPSNIPRWSKQCTGRSLTPTEFAANSGTARTILVCVMRDVLRDQYARSGNNEAIAVQRAAAWWMTGDGSRYNNTQTAPYTKKVLALYQQLRPKASATLSTSSQAKPVRQSPPKQTASRPPKATIERLPIPNPPVVVTEVIPDLPTPTATTQPSTPTVATQPTPQPSAPIVVTEPTPQPSAPIVVTEPTPQPSAPIVVTEPTPQPSVPDIVTEPTPQPSASAVVTQPTPKPPTPRVVTQPTPKPPTPIASPVATPKPTTAVTQPKPKPPTPIASPVATPKPPVAANQPPTRTAAVSTVKVSDAQVVALVEALRRAVPEMDTANNELYSEWQVQPDNIPKWSKQCIQREITPTQFASSPVTARGILVCVMRDVLRDQYRDSGNNESVAVQRAAAWWMSGDGASYQETPTATYAQKVLGFYQELRSNPSTPPPRANRPATPPLQLLPHR